MHKVNRVNHVQKILSIDSALRTNGTASDFDIDVAIPKSNAFNKCSIVMTEMFKSWYTLDSTTTNSFIYNDAVVGTKTVTVASNIIYDSASFGVELQSKLKTASGETGVGALGFTVTRNPSTGKFIFTHPSLIFSIQATNEMAKYMGFKNNVTQFSVFSSGKDVIVSPNVINMQRYDTLSIKASGIQNNGDNVLVRLYPSGVANFGTFGFSSYDSTNNAVTVEDSNMNSMHISVHDNYGKSINLNGINWRMVVTFFNSAD